ncbi:cytochrome c-type biogenesis protein [Parasphingopyxis algicola]|uniref:cytochrome c-type biogenesis protein n=1 Tax=Parasphingopyxis algicola TaxID=2026624 RepID=UPI0015A3B606|nr:cytochrome c-type biogenesis protein [Parasphingopyxis algicola]
MIRWLAIVLLAFGLSGPVHAQSRMPEAEWANRQLPDAAQEAEARELMESLRCLVCQGQSIADSDADMAQDMRALVRRRIAAGEEPEEIRNWLVDRYGRWITYDPPIDGVTWPLWLLPIALIGAGVWLARGRFRRRGKES